MWKKLNDTHLVSDGILSLIIITLLYFVSTKFNGFDSVLNKYDDFTSSMLGIHSTILGFLVTAVSILLTVKDTKYIKALKDNGHYTRLLNIFIWTCYLIAFNVFLLLVLYLLKIEYRFLWILSLYFTILTFVRLMSCFKVLKEVINLSTE